MSTITFVLENEHQKTELINFAKNIGVAPVAKKERITVGRVLEDVTFGIKMRMSESGETVQESEIMKVLHQK